MKDIGEADVILGIRIIRENKGISISQSHYIEKVLKKFNCFDCNPVSTPIDPSVKLMPNTGKAVFQLEYSKMIGCLMYAMTNTRPDIAYAVGKLSRFTSNPSTHRWQAIRRITNVEDHSSTSGWVFLLGGGAISWASKKQTCITNSTMESEFVALAAAGKEAEWLRNLIPEIPLWPKPISPIPIHCDSSATLAKAYSQICWCMMKRITYVNVKVGRFKKLWDIALYTFMNGYGHMACNCGTGHSFPQALANTEFYECKRTKFSQYFKLELANLAHEFTGQV
ncbi:UNVERIFIED_CONTAM: Retrovirus-related Pol polyprotein from transposon TNT 1-94 [Sesamum radiatum]|uniref:Retrovirus-related Pol polyprotein from transposon TNT 1-94 n=1 Tax=Sesamum radiatum TaxID=300843 RepID=A0AAW2RG01_SESRA